jgi:hypothetical protein
MMYQMITGAMAMGLAVAALFFLRFWRETHDRLFGLFALSFLIMALNRIGLALILTTSAHGDNLYWIRFLAFGLILVAILDKNRTRQPPA